MLFKYRIALAVLIGCIHGTLLAAHHATRRLLDMDTRP